MAHVDGCFGGLPTGVLVAARPPDARGDPNVELQHFETTRFVISYGSLRTISLISPVDSAITHSTPASFDPPVLHPWARRNVCTFSTMSFGSCEETTVIKNSALPSSSCRSALMSAIVGVRNLLAASLSSRAIHPLNAPTPSTSDCPNQIRRIDRPSSKESARTSGRTSRTAASMHHSKSGMAASSTVPPTDAMMSTPVVVGPQ